MAPIAKLIFFLGALVSLLAVVQVCMAQEESVGDKAYQNCLNEGQNDALCRRRADRADLILVCAKLEDPQDRSDCASSVYEAYGSN